MGLGEGLKKAGAAALDLFDRALGINPSPVELRPRSPHEIEMLDREARISNLSYFEPKEIPEGRDPLAWLGQELGDWRMWRLRRTHAGQPDVNVPLEELRDHLTTNDPFKERWTALFDKAAAQGLSSPPDEPLTERINYRTDWAQSHGTASSAKLVQER